MPLPTPELQTARLRLRPFTDADAAPLYALHSSAHVLRYCLTLSGILARVSGPGPLGGHS